MENLPRMQARSASTDMLSIVIYHVRRGRETPAGADGAFGARCIAASWGLLAHLCRVVACKAGAATQLLR